MTEFTIECPIWRRNTDRPATADHFEAGVHLGPARVLALLQINGTVRIDGIADPDLRNEIAAELRSKALLELDVRWDTQTAKDAEQRAKEVAHGLQWQQWSEEINAALQAKDEVKAKAREAAAAKASR